MKKSIWIAIICSLSTILSAQGKIEPSLAQKLQNERSVFFDITIYLDQKADIQSLIAQKQGEGKLNEELQIEILKTLRSVANKSQASLLEQLKAQKGVQKESIRPLWIINAVEVIANASAIQKIADLPEIDYIEETSYSEPAAYEKVEDLPALPLPNGHEPGLEIINAHKMWKLGYTGYGTIAYIYDTGIDRYHPALETNFRYHNASMAASFKGTEIDPYACDDHGSHVTGTVCGIDRVRNDTIGVAFNAEFITSAQFSTCEDKRVSDNVAFQWAIDPDEDPNTLDDIPDVMNMSGGRPDPNAGFCSNNDVLAIYNTFEAVDMAAIIAAGNEGPENTTVRSPAILNYDLVHSFAVGNINADIMAINPSSSRGPSICFSSDSSLLIKPEVSAPGTNIRSSVVGGGYSAFTGTSMASPHTAGAFLLLREAFHDLTEEDLLLAMYFTAVDMGAPGEDNEYGMGMLDIYAAYQYLVNQGHTPTPPVPADRDVIAIHLETKTTLLCEGRLEATFTFENAGADTLREVLVIFKEANQLFAPDTVRWQGILPPDEVTTINYTRPGFLPGGLYELQAQLAMPNGVADPRDLNNYYKYPFQMLEADYVIPGVSASVDSSICIGSSILLENQTPLVGEQGVYWYSQNNLTIPLADGNTFLTPPIDGPFTYLMDVYTPYTVGKTMEENDNMINESDVNRGLVFDVQLPIYLKSVKVNAAEKGGRIIKLYDGEGNSLATKLLNIQEVGEQRIELNIFVPSGDNYFLTIDAGRSLSHHITGVDFPYEVADVIQITKARDDQSDTRFRYFYFYEWEVEALSACGKIGLDLDISTTDTASLINFEQSIDTANFFPGIEVQFTDLSDNAVAWTWDFGNGNTSREQNPVNAYQMPGTYQNLLAIRDNRGCNNAISKPLTLLETTSTKEEEIAVEQVLLFPNPAFDQLTLFMTDQLLQLEGIRLTVVDINGKTMKTIQGVDGLQEVNIDLVGLPAGLYVLMVSTNAGIHAVNRFVKK
jgi:subtilisin family serine protease